MSDAIADADFESYVQEILAACRKQNITTHGAFNSLVVRDVLAGHQREVEEAAKRLFDKADTRDPR